MNKEEIKRANAFLNELDKSGYMYSADGRETYIIKNVFEVIDQLQKENQKLRDIKNKAIGHINCCKTSLGNYLLSPSEVECLLDILKEGDIE